MKKRFTRFLIFAFLILPLFGFSQGENNIWYFGHRAGLDFNSGSPVVLTNAASTFLCWGYSSAISDSAGNLLFYVDDSYVYNKNQQAMPNGSLFGTGSNLQATFIVKKLDEDSVYYLFTMDIWPFPTYPDPLGLLYTIVDMRLDGGLGDIPSGQKGIVMPGAENTVEMLTGTRAKNNRDVWIVARKYQNSTEYLSYHITNAGIDMNPVVSNSLVTLLWPTFSNYPEMLRFSPDGTRLVATYDTIHEMCNFNPSTGEITPMFCFKTGNGYSTSFSYPEFSVDNRYLYIDVDNQSLPYTDRIFQYNVSKTDSAQFKQSEILINAHDYRCSIQRGPDNKIYCGHTWVDSLDVINNPTIQGLGCNYHRDAIWLEGNSARNGLVQQLQRYFVYFQYINHCQGDSIFFTSTIWPQTDSIHWDFGDPASGPANFSFNPNPSHTYSLPGSYTVTLFVRHIDMRTDTAWQVVTVHPTYQPLLGPDQSVCIGNSVTFDAGVCAGCTYQWMDLTTGLPVGTGQTYTTGLAGNYEVAVTNTFGCIGRDTVQLVTNPQPVVTNNPLSKTICSGESTNIALTSNEPGTNFHWTAGLTSGNISGFSADSGLVINQILTNNGSSAGIVTYHIVPKVGGCSGPPVVFPVTVNPGDSVKVLISASTNNVCSGTSVTFQAFPTNGGSSPSYQWKVNGINIGASNPIYTYVPLNGDIVSCVLTSSNSTCISNNPASSNQVIMVIISNSVVGVGIAASQNPVCAGIPVNFTATPTNGGTSPSYQWKVNGINVGISIPSYSYTPNNGDIVICILSSSETCTSNNPAASNQLFMVIHSNSVVDLSITASANPVCSGIVVTYTATAVNGGNSPVYQWKVNGVNVGTNSSTYMYNPVSGDQIVCILTSNIVCPIGNPATSNIITMNVATSPIVTFTLCNDSITNTSAQPFKLKGGIPLGGTYSGVGVTNGIYYPAIAGVGTHQINYTYTNAALCIVTNHRSLITINPALFICGNSFTDIRDGKTYQTVHIGSQCWLAEDLNYGIEILPDVHQRDNCIPEKYHNPASSIQHPASVYQWDELMQYDEIISNQGLCPPGWHVPTEADWNTLFANYISNAFAASPLKYSGFSGFNALLSGGRHLNKAWDFQGFATFFWSSTAHGSTKAWAHGMNDADPSVSAYPSLRSNAFSVRCLRD